MFGTEEKCLNGRHNFDYQLSKLTEVQQLWLSRNRSFVTFLESNINHSNQMHHLSWMDPHLEKYLETMSKHPDTMFIIFADHGNKFLTEYISKQSPEGDTDKHHPFLFVLLPENEARFFSQSEIRALSANQNRLLTIRDLHYLVDKFSKDQRQIEGLVLNH